MMRGGRVFRLKALTLRRSGVDIYIIFNLSLGQWLVALLDNHHLILVIREFHYKSWRFYLSLLKLLPNLGPLASNGVSQVFPTHGCPIQAQGSDTADVLEMIVSHNRGSHP